MPEITIAFIFDLFYNRQTKVITYWNTTEAFEVNNRIKQEKVLSSLVWRNFYDPLLERIQEDHNLDYTLSVAILLL